MFKHFIIKQNQIIRCVRVRACVCVYGGDNEFHWILHSLYNSNRMCLKSKSKKASY